MRRWDEKGSVFYLSVKRCGGACDYNLECRFEYLHKVGFKLTKDLSHSYAIDDV